MGLAKGDKSEMNEKREPLLAVKNLSVSFQEERGFKRRRIQPIRDLSLEICAGEITALAGASGSGKSLLAQAVMGILPEQAAAEGTIEFQGQELTKEYLRALRGREIALIPQGVNGLDPLMRAGNQIRKGRKDLASLKRMEELLERYGLPGETADAYPFELSGGMARRVLTAGAMMERPRLVIADEPTPGLDKKTAMGVMDHFRQMAERGAGVLLITHDLELAVRSADRVTVLYGGRTVEETEASSFLDEGLLKHPYTKALCRSMPGKWPSADALENDREDGIPGEGILEYMRKEYGR